MSTFYLKFSPVTMTSANVALADEVKPPEKKPDLSDREMMLRKKEKELEEKEAAFKKQEQELIPLKKEIESRMEKLTELQSTLTVLSKKLAEKEKAMKDSKIEHLVKLYKSMDPGKAAIILDKLDIDTVVRILGNMRGKYAGQILAMMPPEKGASISRKLSKTDSY